MVLRFTWARLTDRLAELARGVTSEQPLPEDVVLRDLGLVGGTDLTTHGQQIYMATSVLMDADAEGAAIADMLKAMPEVNGFCEALWPAGEVPVEGAVNFVRRLTPEAGPLEAKRLLELMSRGRLITYNRKQPRIRIVYNPRALTEGLDPDSEQARSHLLAPDTKFGNLMSLRDMLGAAREWIRWYEQHMPEKVLEVLYREIQTGSVTTIRLLSGPANITKDLKAAFEVFAVEMLAKRGITCEWRVLSKAEAQNHHDRFFLSNQLSRNLPPLNSILKGTTGEILPSDMTASRFDALWALGADLRALSL